MRRASDPRDPIDVDNVATDTGFAQSRRIAERAAALGVDVTLLPGDRLTLDLPDDSRRAYAAANATMAVTSGDELK